MDVIYQPKQIIFGENSLMELATLVKRKGMNHLLVIMDNILTKPPMDYDEKINHLLSSIDVKVDFYSGYRGEPTTDDVKNALDLIMNKEVDGVVAVGGGSAIDIAKAVSLFSKSPTIRWDEIAEQRELNRLPLIAIPTTAGTGSEATKVMVITDTEKDIKMNPGHSDLVPDIAILDPNLTSSLPKNFTAFTGMDALTHAIEAYVSNRANPITDHYALSAIEMIGKALPKVYENGKDLFARKEMLIASTYAGIAFSNASTNLAHAASRPLGARFNIPHGLSVSLLLPFVMRFGLKAAPERYAQIAVALGSSKDKSTGELAEQSIKIINTYNEDFQIWQAGLQYIDTTELSQAIDTLVEDSLSGNGILTNRIVPTEKDVREVFTQLIDKLEKVRQDEKSIHVAK